MSRPAPRPSFHVASLALVAVAAVAACSSAAGPRDGTFSASLRGGSVVHLANGTDAPVFTFIIGENAAAHVNWAPCVDAACDPVPAHAARDTVVLVDPHAESHLLVYWWHAEDTPGGPRPDSVRVVPLTR